MSASRLSGLGVPLVIVGLMLCVGYLVLERPVRVETKVKEVEVEKRVEVPVYIDRNTKLPVPTSEGQMYVKQQRLDPTTGQPAPMALEFERRVTDPNERVKTLRDWTKKEGDENPDTGHEYDYDHGWKVVDVYGTPCILYLRGDVWVEEMNPVMDCLEPSS